MLISLLACVLILIVLFLLWVYQPVPKNKDTGSDDASNTSKQGFGTGKKVPEQVDIIVIGAGIGGLTAAALLAKEGKRVLVLEQHDQAGGNTHVFNEQGFEFDTGLHYVGKSVSISLVYIYISLTTSIIHIFC